MSAYRVPIVVAALAVIALGAPCQDAGAHGDTCSTGVDVDGTGFSEVYLLQSSMELREVALHKAADAKGKHQTRLISLLQDVKHSILSSGRDSSITAALKRGEGVTGGQGAGTEASTVEGKVVAPAGEDAAAESDAVEGKGAATVEGEGAAAEAVAVEGKAAAAEKAKGAGTEAGTVKSKAVAPVEVKGAGAEAVTGEGNAASPVEGEDKGAEAATVASNAAAPVQIPVEVTAPAPTPEPSEGAIVHVVSGKDDAAVNASKDNDVVWVTPPKAYTDAAEAAAAAAPEGQTLPLGWIIWALIIATCLVLVLIALVVMVYRQNKREQ